MVFFPGMVFAQTAGNLSTDFWLTFPQGDLENPPRNETLLISSTTATSGTVQIPGLAYSTPFTVSAGGMATLGLPFACMPKGSEITEFLGIHVTSLSPVAVVGFSNEGDSSEAYLALPTATLGRSYITLSYEE
jgi:hypothetical protein